ncbi:50S ribosomal protein L23 [Candidatus Peregrinibacteria bacterium]|nr:50S ribosomal protein L23 [Candidatus Peregrinibacteria bacterium]
MNAHQVIIRPVVTEKATRLAEKMSYVFLVHTKATKIDVKKAIKEIYGHDVATVRSSIVSAKKRVIRRAVVNKRDEMKKVIVTLKGRKKFDITKFAKEAKK